MVKAVTERKRKRDREREARVYKSSRFFQVPLLALTSRTSSNWTSLFRSNTTFQLNGLQIYLITYLLLHLHSSSYTFIYLKILIFILSLKLYNLDFSLYYIQFKI